jgi:hypothetical protein
MSENTQRSRGRPENYKFDRGGMPAEMGPFIGTVVNNVDTTRSGRLQVYIDQFGATNKDGTPSLGDPSLWRTVSYCPPFYGATVPLGTSAGVGTYPGNSNSYGMWFTPPDIGVQVLCFFVGGDPGKGYYVGCVPTNGINRMIPAIGAVDTKEYALSASAKASGLFNDAKQLPVIEINELNKGINQNPKFYDQQKPVQNVIAGTFLQQGLITDTVRGPIKSSSQRESPSSVYGISTPGKPIYQGGLKPETIKKQLETGAVKPQDIVVIGRMGGHTLVMDDGDLSGKDTLVRIRTAKGHQITMSDDGNCFYICHANGQSWIELGQNGTIDLYSTNSVNVRTQGTLNLHADKDINLYAGGSIKAKAQAEFKLEGVAGITMNSSQAISMYGQTKVGIRSDGALALQSKTGSWNGGGSLNFKASVINLNGGKASPVTPVRSMTGFKLADTRWVENKGWTSQPGVLSTIVTRAPTHEPFKGHNSGVDVTTNLNDLSANAIATSTSTSTVTLPTVASNTDLAKIGFNRIATRPVAKPLTKAEFIGTTPATSTVPAETA